MTTTSFLPRSAAAPPLDDDDLLSEILLRLPPQPSSLPRASLVCRRWRSLLSDPAFRRRFRIHHRRSPPLLGFIDANQGITFQPALDAPDRLPRGHFSLDLHDRYMTLGWRHGLALFFLPISLQVVVWDPVAGVQHRLAVPRGFGFHPLENPINGTVLRAAGEIDHFQVVLVSSDGKQPRRALGRVYSSETGVWGDTISCPVPLVSMVHLGEPAVLAGDCIYWCLPAALAMSWLCGQRVVGWVSSSCQASSPNFGRGRQTVMAMFLGAVEELLNWTSYFPQIQRKSHRI
ncbi:hypothetical protein VPH35_103170 [Triticum aestivum]